MRLCHPSFARALAKTFCGASCHAVAAPVKRVGLHYIAISLLPLFSCKDLHRSNALKKPKSPHS